MLRRGGEWKLLWMVDRKEGDIHVGNDLSGRRRLLSWVGLHFVAPVENENARDSDK